MNCKKDVCIIGGGVMGLSIAYYLSKAGKSVIVLEKKDIGNGASATCDDMIMMQAKQAGINLTLAIDGLELFRGLTAELDSDIGFSPCGGMILIEDETQRGLMEGFVRKQRASGLEIDIVGRDVIDRYQPYVNKDIVSSTYCPWDCQIDPILLLRGYMKAANRLGAQIRRHSEVSGYAPKGDHWCVTVRDGFEVECDNVVIATGAWAKDTGAIVGVELPITPRRGQLVITEQIPVIGKTHLWSAAYLASKLDPSLVPDRSEYAKRVGLGFAFSRTRDGNHVIGSTRENAGFDKTSTARATSAILRQAARYVPVLRQANVIRVISGFRPATPDGKSIVGPVDGRPGLFVCAGHEGDGISLAPITGINVAAMICGGHVDPRFEPLNQRRFS